MKSTKYHELMNNTKWEEIRLEMYRYPVPTKWRTRDLEIGYISNWELDWYYHFKIGGYKTIEWLEIKVDNDRIKNDIVGILKKMHVPGKILSDSVVIYGYIENEIINYI